MASSKDVLTVLGMLCVDRGFREQFFGNPQGKAEYLVGKLREDELTRILALAGKRSLPGGKTRQDYIASVTDALEGVSAAIGCTCPSPPCPEPCPDTNEY
jgi:hypothetical protein